MTRYSVHYTRRAIRAITEELPEKIAAAAVEFIEGPLSANPYRLGKELMTPYESCHGARRGEYRVIYEIFDDIIQIDIIDVGHRRDIYRRR